MKISTRLSSGIVDVLVKLVFASIAGVVTPLIIGGQIVPLAYIWLASIILLIILLIRDYQTYMERPFVHRYRNEEAAFSAIREVISGTKKRLFILSKVGTSIFFMFPEYSRLLENQRVIQVLVVDPDDSALIGLMDKIYIHQEMTVSRWSQMLNQIHSQLDTLYGNGQIAKEPYLAIKACLLANEGYRSVIIASVLMWQLAETMANERLRQQEMPITVHGLDIRIYNVLPDVKAWVADHGWGAVGHYDALQLGRDNPVDIYKPTGKHNLEQTGFDNILVVWDYKFEQSRKPNISEFMRRYSPAKGVQAD